VKVLVTGASGFIGRNMLRMLLNQGYEVASIGRHTVDTPGVEEIIIPRLDYDELDNAFEGRGVDAIVHLAAAGVNPHDRDDVEVMRVNSLLPGILVLLAAKYQIKSVVVAGSSSEYQVTRGTQKLNESSALECKKLYGATKAAGSLLALSQGEVHQVPVAIVRLFNAYGPGEAPHRLLPSLLSNLWAGNEVKLSLGTQIRDFVYIADVCSGLIAVMNALTGSVSNSGVYNLSTGIGNSVRDFALTVASIMAVDDDLLKFGALPFRPDDEPYVVGDNKAIKQLCGWSPQFSMSDGIAEVVALNQIERCK